MEGIKDKTSGCSDSLATGWSDAYEREKRCCVYRHTLDIDFRAWCISSKLFAIPGGYALSQILET